MKRNPGQHWIPMSSVPDSTNKNFQDSGIRITLHGEISPLCVDYLNGNIMMEL